MSVYGWKPERTEDGSWTLLHPEHGEACHSHSGGWLEARERYAPPSLAAEGFVHLSHAEQLAGTLSTHFSAYSRVVLCEVAAPSVAGDLALEPSRGGELFPHLYRALDRRELVRSWSLVREDGGFLLPSLGEHPAEDRPPGRSTTRSPK